MKFFKQIPEFPDYIVFRDGTVVKISNGNQPVVIVNIGTNTLRVNLYINGKRYNKIVKKIVAQAFKQNPNNYLRNILHKDEDITNCHYSNLYYTNEQLHRGGHKGIRGENKNNQAKLNNQKVAFILLSKKTTTTLAKMFNVSHSVISGIKNGYRWIHISKLNNEQLLALAKGIDLSYEEQLGIITDNTQNVYSRKGVNNIVISQEQERRKIPLKINEKTTIMVAPEKLRTYKRKYNLV